MANCEETKDYGYINETVKPEFKHDCVFEKDYMLKIKKCKICGKIIKIT